MIYNFQNSSEYLKAFFARDQLRSGLKTKFANSIGIKKSFLSQVLSTRLHLSLEQTEKASLFLGHSQMETRYFRLMVLRDRAGTFSLKQQFTDEMKEIASRSETVRHHIKVNNEIGEKEKYRYYSSWLYAAVHVATSIPQLQTRSALKAYFSGIDSVLLGETLSFLISSGLVKESSGRLVHSEANIHLNSNAKEIRQHHTNWRLKSVEKLDKRDIREDLRYSGVVSLSKADVVKVKEIFLEALNKSAQKIMASKEEELHAINLDFFKV